MGYRNLQSCLDRLAATGQLLRIQQPIDPHLEAAEIHRRVYQAGGPAIYFANVIGCRFPMVSNLFGTRDRVHFIFQDTLDKVRRLVELKTDPGQLRRRPLKYLSAAGAAWSMLPRTVTGGPVLAERIGYRPATPIAIVAARRRRIHHTAAGLYRRSPLPRTGPLELGHVSRADFRRPISHQ